MATERIKLEIINNSQGEVLGLVDPNPRMENRFDPNNISAVIAAAKRCKGCPMESDCRPIYRNRRYGILRSMRLSVTGEQVANENCILTLRELSVRSLGNKDRIKAIKKLGLTKIQP